MVGWYIFSKKVIREVLKTPSSIYSFPQKYTFIPISKKYAEVYSEPCQTSEKNIFAKIVNEF